MDMLVLEGQWRHYRLRGEGANTGWHGLVRGSFQARTLLPPTAWICLENESQRLALMKKQQETLSAAAGLDVDEEATSMSEPGLWWFLLIVPILYWRSRPRT
jgi:hypothetical protein